MRRARRASAISGRVESATTWARSCSQYSRALRRSFASCAARAAPTRLLKRAGASTSDARYSTRASPARPFRQQHVAQQLAGREHRPRRHGVLAGLVLEVRARAGEQHGLVLAALAVRDPGRRGQPHGLHLARPRVARRRGLGQGDLDFLELAERRAGPVGLTRARGADRLREVRRRGRVRIPLPGKLGHGQAQVRGALPVAALERPARGDGHERVPGRELGVVEFRGRDGLVEHAARARVVADLQVGVFEVVQCVHGVEREGAGVALGREAPGRVGRGEVRGDGLLPEAEAREDVRRHVERVRRRRRDLRVGARGRQRLFRERRVVEGVDHVVRDAGVPGLRGEEPVQDRGPLLLPRERRVARGRAQEQRVEDRGLVVVRKPPGDRQHGLLVGRRAGRVRERPGIPVEDADRVDVSPLALGRSSERGRFLRGRPAGRELRGIRRGPDGVVVGHGDAPVGHRATGVLLRHELEGPARLFVSERVHEGDGAREVRLDLRAAGRREVDFAELVARAVGMVVRLLPQQRRRREHPDRRENSEQRFHRAPPGPSTEGPSLQVRRPVNSRRAPTAARRARPPTARRRPRPRSCP